MSDPERIQQLIDESAIQRAEFEQRNEQLERVLAELEPDLKPRLRVVRDALAVAGAMGVGLEAVGRQVKIHPVSSGAALAAVIVLGVVALLPTGDPSPSQGVALPPNTSSPAPTTPVTTTSPSAPPSRTSTMPPNRDLPNDPAGTLRNTQPTAQQRDVRPAPPESVEPPGDGGQDETVPDEDPGAPNEGQDPDGGEDPAAPERSGNPGAPGCAVRVDVSPLVDVCVLG